MALRPAGSTGNGGIGLAFAGVDGSESPDRLVARSRKPYVVPLTKVDTMCEQQVVIGRLFRFHTPSLAWYSSQ